MSKKSARKGPVCHDYTYKARRSGWGVVRFDFLGPGTVAITAFGLKDIPHHTLKQAYLLAGEEVVISMPDGDVLYEITDITYNRDPHDLYYAKLRYIQHLTGFRILGQSDPAKYARQLEWGQKHYSNPSRPARSD